MHVPAPEAAAPAAPQGRPGQLGQAVDLHGRVVNQFGTPIEQTAAPAGPAAAPGYGAQAWGGPGLTGNAGRTPPAAANCTPPGTRAADSSVRPPTVLAAGVVAIVQGVLAVIVALLGFAAVSALESELAQVQGGVQLTAQVSGFVRLVLFLVLLVGVLYLVAGIGAAAGRRWGAWILLVVESVGLVLGVIGLLEQLDADRRSTGAAGGTGGPGGGAGAAPAPTVVGLAAVALTARSPWATTPQVLTRAAAATPSPGRSPRPAPGTAPRRAAAAAGCSRSAGPTRVGRMHRVVVVVVPAVRAGPSPAHPPTILSRGTQSGVGQDVGMPELAADAPLTDVLSV